MGGKKNSNRSDFVRKPKPTSSFMLTMTMTIRTGRAGAEGLAITLFTEHDKAQSGSLINVLKAAGQAVPDELLRFGTTVKKKGHEAYGAFYKETENTKAATKIRFDG